LVCGSLEDNEKEYFEFSSTSANSIAGLQCRLPYTLRGDPEYKCSPESGRWRGTGYCGMLKIDVNLSLIAAIP